MTPEQTTALTGALVALVIICVQCLTAWFAAKAHAKVAATEARTKRIESLLNGNKPHP